jgi:hypothetical protein
MASTCEKEISNVVFMLMAGGYRNAWQGSNKALTDESSLCVVACSSSGQKLDVCVFCAFIILVQIVIQ